MYDFVFHFLPQYVYSLSPEDRSQLDDTIFLELNCPPEFNFELHKIKKGDFICRVITFEPSCFADMEVPMCMIVTCSNDEKLLGYFTLEKDDFMGYVLCKVDAEEHALLGNMKWQEIPSKEQFAKDVISKYIEREIV